MKKVAVTPYSSARRWDGRLQGDQPPAASQDVERAVQGRPSDSVDDDVEDETELVEAHLFEGDHVSGAQLFHQGSILLSRGRRDGSTGQSGELDGEGANSSGPAVDEDPFSGLNLGVVVQGLPGGQCGQGKGGRHRMGDRRRLGRDMVGGNGNVLGGGAVPIEWNEAVNIVPDTDSRNPGPDGGDHSGHLMDGTVGVRSRPSRCQVSSQLNSAKVIPAACTSMISSPGTGEGTGASS